MVCFRKNNLSIKNQLQQLASRQGRNMKKSIITLIIFLVLHLLHAQTAVAPASGNGSAENPYRIASLENLYWIAASDMEVPSPAQSVRWYSHYIQTADIDASPTAGWFSGAGWLPISSSSISGFSGVYDGKGHTIDGLYMNRPSTFFTGLFGHADEALIMNLGLTDANITGSDPTGCLAGRSNSSKIINCYSSGSVQGHYAVGGLVGDNRYNSLISHCHSSATVIGEYNVGGLAGVNYLDAVIRNSYSTGAVGSYGIAQNIGGLAGYNQERSSIVRCFSSGAVSGLSNVGGLLGANGFACTVHASFWDIDSSGQTTSAGGSGVSSADMRDQSTFSDAGWNFHHIWNISAAGNQGYPSLRNKTMLYQAITPLMPYSGNGTPENPYRISNLNHLYWIAASDQIVATPSAETRRSAHYLQTNSINAYATYTWFLGEGWVPIGNFTGSYDGNGFSIDGLYAKGSRNTGFFAKTDQALIVNLDLANAAIEGERYAGILAGESVQSQIYYVHTQGIVNGTSEVGGLVGQLHLSTIRNCGSQGVVSGTKSSVITHTAGGLVGYSHTSHIFDSYSNCTVLDGNAIGGLVGYIYGAGIYKCYSSGRVRVNSSANYAGGLIGRLGSDYYTSNTIHACFWDTEASGLTNSAGWETTGMTTVQMQTESTFTDAGWDFTRVWRSDVFQNDGYPILRDRVLISATDVQPEPPSGTGTPQDPYRIGSLENLYWITASDSLVPQSPLSARWSAHYIQTADIDADPVHTWFYGEGWAPIGNDTLPFSGSYNGQGSKIGNLYINRRNRYQGLFGNTSGAVIHNLGLTDGSIWGGWATGALTGSAAASRIHQCFTTGTVSGYSTGIGGISGVNLDAARIENSYSFCTIYGDGGGIAGRNDVTSVISHCYSAGKGAGLAGNNNNNNGEVIASFWDMEVSGVTISGGGTGKSTAEMTNPAVFADAGWDFLEIWGMERQSHSGYPFLQWQQTDIKTFVHTRDMNRIGGTFARVDYDLYMFQNAPPHRHGICWNREGDPDILHDSSSDGDGSSYTYSAEMAGLSPNTDYYVRAFAVLESGTEYGNILQFRTLPFDWDAPIDGDGSAQDPYRIADLGNLYWISQDTDRWNDHYIQIASINASATRFLNGGTGWMPIGNNTVKFTGSYDGDRHVIDSLFIDQSAVYSSVPFGLFGSIQNASISNLGVSNADIKVKGTYIGGLCAYIDQSTISQCFSTGTVTGIGNSAIGGLVGYSGNLSNISNSYSLAAVDGEYFSGGLVAYHINSTINKCYSAGTMPKSGSYIGGLIGYNSNADVQASFWDTESSGQTASAEGTAKTTAEMKTPNTFIAAGWDYLDLWVSNENINAGYPSFYWQDFLPRIRTLSLSEITPVSATLHYEIGYLGEPAADRYGICWNNSGIPTLQDHYLNEGTVDSAGRYSSRMTDLTPGTLYHVRPYVLSAADTAYGAVLSFMAMDSPEGEGSEENPYRISGQGDLLWLSLNPDSWNKYFLQTANIDIGNVNGEDGWVPVGNQDTRFSGNYNGQGHLIENLSINRTLEDHIGFFGYISSASIRDLGIVNANVFGNKYVGALIGENMYSGIERCFSSGSVAGNSDVGGLLGRTYFTTISDCYSHASVHASVRNAGGLSGWNDYMSINNCYSTGAVTAPLYAGGFAGICYGGSINNCFWDIQTSGQAVSSEATGKSTEEMQTRSTYTDAGWDFDTIWDINNAYPFLQWQIQSQSPVVFTESLGNVTTHSATVQYDVTDLGSSNPVQHGVCWSSNGEPTIADDKTEAGVLEETGTFIAEISGLPEDQIYYVRAYATNDAGTGYGGTLNFRTLGRPEVNTANVTDIDTAGALAKGMITRLGNPALTQHGFCWSTEGDPSLDDARTEQGSRDTIGNFETAITGLLPNTLYYLCAYAVNVIDTAFSPVHSFRTLGKPSVSQITLLETDSTTVRLQAVITDLGNPAPVQHGFCWDSEGVPTIESGKIELGEADSIGIFSTTINELLQNTRYYVRAFVTNSVKTVYSDTLSFTTLETAIASVPEEFTLAQNYPNPFNPRTHVKYGLPQVSDVRIVIFDVNGRRIKSWNIGNQPPGWYTLLWDGTDNSGRTVSTGVYICSMQAGTFVATRKMLLMK